MTSLSQESIRQNHIKQPSHHLPPRHVMTSSTDPCEGLLKPILSTVIHDNHNVHSQRPDRTVHGSRSSGDQPL